MRCIGATDLDIQKSIGGGRPRCSAWFVAAFICWRKREFIAYATLEKMGHPLFGSSQTDWNRFDSLHTQCGKHL